MANKNIDHKKYTNSKLIRVLFYIFLIGIVLIPILSLLITMFY